MFKLYHPKYGYADVMAENFVGGRGVRYIGAAWGAYKIYANVPASEVEIRLVKLTIERSPRKPSQDYEPNMGWEVCWADKVDSEAVVATHAEAVQAAEAILKAAVAQ